MTPSSLHKDHTYEVMGFVGERTHMTLMARFRERLCDQGLVQFTTPIPAKRSVSWRFLPGEGEEASNQHRATPHQRRTGLWALVEATSEGSQRGYYKIVYAHPPMMAYSYARHLFPEETTL